MTRTLPSRFVTKLWAPGGLHAKISQHPTDAGRYCIELLCEYVLPLRYEHILIEDHIELLPEFIRTAHAHIRELKRDATTAAKANGAA